MSPVIKEIYIRMLKEHGEVKSIKVYPEENAYTIHMRADPDFWPEENFMCDIRPSYGYTLGPGWSKRDYPLYI